MKRLILGHLTLCDRTPVTYGCRLCIYFLFDTSWRLGIDFMSRICWQWRPPSSTFISSLEKKRKRKKEEERMNPKVTICNVVLSSQVQNVIRVIWVIQRLNVFRDTCVSTFWKLFRRPFIVVILWQLLNCSMAIVLCRRLAASC